ncbi:hypothetical protein FDP41_008523 [Naegleria fowleri]|uniref:Uncharacterized protein n=1 Tax=Naegleria fowleri TaxID=5763 RepID=A0A6A5BFC4_NAEFO|nr:uncharacterized protein FDP41_008523 [Naegleria fowleri]KAF0973316.1 hypothetical protein FDP41_008523 [Naegleria fowleri]CAG4711286.1 unnamed protein product [Naegleria fowleri]
MKQFFAHRFRRHSGDSSHLYDQSSSHDDNDQKSSSTNRSNLKIRAIPKTNVPPPPRRKSETDAVLMQSTHPVNTQGVYGFMDYTVHKNANNLYTYGNQPNQF